MIEVNLFATLREGREKKYRMDPAEIRTGEDILRKLSIPAGEVAIFLINGFHRTTADPVKDGDVVSIFPPVAGG